MYYYAMALPERALGEINKQINAVVQSLNAMASPLRARRGRTRFRRAFEQGL
jgi:hypothetical protein